MTGRGTLACAWGRGGIGIRRRLKIFGLRDCGFESHRPYHASNGSGDGAVFASGPAARTRAREGAELRKREGVFQRSARGPVGPEANRGRLCRTRSPTAPTMRVAFDTPLKLQCTWATSMHLRNFDAPGDRAGRLFWSIGAPSFFKCSEFWLWAVERVASRSRVKLKVACRASVACGSCRRARAAGGGLPDAQHQIHLVGK